MKRFVQLTPVLATVGLGLGLVLNVGAAQARIGDDNAPRTITLDLKDLDLKTPQGQSAVMRRIKWAADVVCGAPDSRDLRMAVEYRNCISEATNSAMAKIKFPKN